MPQLSANEYRADGSGRTDSALRRAISDVERANAANEETLDRWLRFAHDLVSANRSYLYRRDDNQSSYQLLRAINPPKEDAARATVANIKNVSAFLSESCYHLSKSENGEVLHCIAMHSHGTGKSRAQDEFAVFETAEGTPFVHALTQERLELAASLYRSTTFARNLVADPSLIEGLSEVSLQPSLNSSLQSAAGIVAEALGTDFATVLCVTDGSISELGIHGVDRPSATHIAEIRSVASESLDFSKPRLFTRETENSLVVKNFLANGVEAIAVAPAMTPDGQSGCIIVAETKKLKLAADYAQKLKEIVIAKQGSGLRARARRLLNRLPLLNAAPQTHRGKLLAGVALLIAFMPVPTTLVAPAKLQSKDRHVITAPISARLDEVLVEPGDRVFAGETLIAKLDTRDLESERSALVAKKSAYLAEYAAARAAKKPADARIAFLRSEQADAELSLIDLKIGNASIIAPATGLIIGDNLRDQLGAQKTSGDKLFEVASTDQFEIVINASALHAQKLDSVKTSGKLRLRSFPGRPLSFDVKHIYPSTEFSGNINSIRIVAALSEDQKNISALIPGMEGKAHIHSGWRPLAWSAMREPIQKLRIFTSI